MEQTLQNSDYWGETLSADTIIDLLKTGTDKMSSTGTVDVGRLCVCKKAKRGMSLFPEEHKAVAAHVYPAAAAASLVWSFWV